MQLQLQNIALVAGQECSMGTHSREPHSQLGSAQRPVAAQHAPHLPQQQHSSTTGSSSGPHLVQQQRHLRSSAASKGHVARLQRCRHGGGGGAAQR